MPVSVPGRTPLTVILSIVLLTFLGYGMIGLPLAVLPGFVHDGLGYGTMVTGLSITIQYLATVLSRSQVGRLCDVHGPKYTVLRGFAACAASGVLLTAAALCGGHHQLSLILLIASRLGLGVGESLVSTGATTWAAGVVGPREFARVWSWNGIASYGGLALMAPCGVIVAGHAGLVAVGLCSLLLAVIGWVLAWIKPALAVLVSGKRLSFAAVVWRVMLPGTILALGATGFGSVATFITLFYGSHGWNGAAMALSGFGCAFMLARLLFADCINRFGGVRVTLVSLAVECVGLLLLCTARSPTMALIGTSIAGLGFSLVSPAIGVVAVARVPAQNRGSALGLYSMFLDISLGLTGPIAGVVVGAFGNAAAFLFAAIATVAGFGLTLVMQRGGETQADAEIRPVAAGDVTAPVTEVG